MKLEKYVSPVSSIAIVISTAVFVLLFGTLFSSTYKSDCTRDPDTNKRTCTDHLEFTGWAGLPIQPIASAVGIGSATFIAYRKAKTPVETVELLAGKSTEET